MKTSPCNTVSLFIFSCLTACITQKQINPGVYEEFGSENTMLGEKEEIILYPDRNQTFEYRFHSKETSADKYGSGTYRQTDKKLILRFSECAPPRSYTEPIASDSGEDQLNYQLKIIDSKSGKVLPGIKATIFDPLNRELSKAVSDQHGMAILTLPPEANPAHFTINSPAYDPVQQELPPASSSYRVTLAVKYPVIINKGTVMKFDILDVSLNHMDLMRNNKEKHFALK